MPLSENQIQIERLRWKRLGNDAVIAYYKALINDNLHNEEDIKCLNHLELENKKINKELEKRLKLDCFE